MSAHAPSFTAADLAAQLGATLEGDPAVVLTAVADLETSVPGDVAVAGSEHYLKLVPKCRASALIVPEGVPVPEPHGVLLRVADVQKAFLAVCALYAPPPPELPDGISPLASVSPDAVIGEGVAIGPFAVVEPGAVLGPGTRLYPQTYVGHFARLGADCLVYPFAAVRERCILGDRVILHCGAVVGADGFGYTVDAAGVRTKIPQTGIVELGDDVEIGANTTIDRARFGVTRVGKGSKIDNLVQIAHNCVLGEHVVLCAQSGMAGTTNVGSHVICAGQAGLAGHLKIGDWAIVGAQAGVTKDLPGAAAYFGSPAVPRLEFGKSLAHTASIPKLKAQLKALSDRLAALEAQQK